MAPQGATSAERAEPPVESIRSIHADTRSPPRHNVPVRQTSFIGRATELAELLASADCRLLTIIGPGGIGKTRLALEAAEASQATFADGTTFVPLQTLSATESIAPALAAATGCILKGNDDARDQVARFLGPRHLLLVLDNFEHLLGEAPWLGELLAAAPGVRMLVTSREALNLREEWRYPLAGLAAPSEEAAEPGQFEAVRLFVERAQQVRRDFSLAAEQDGVVRLCRITGGLPLALELAAAWTRTLSCAAIADEIESNFAFLATDLRNVPIRHRSMQAAFDHSWTLLSEDERHTYRRLAIFRGGFGREAAEQVTGATLALLSSLVDKSLLRREVDGRFHQHELLRQYAEEHLRAIPDEAMRTHAAHRDFFLAFLATRFEPITGGAQREATIEIAAELDNIRAAWRGAVAAGDVEALGRVSHTLTLFHDFRARYREGLALLEEGLRALRAAAPSPLVDRILAAMLIDAVRLNQPLGRVSAVRAALAESEAIYTRLADPPPPGQMTDPRLWRALLALMDGQYAEAARLSAEAVRRNTDDHRPGNLPIAWSLQAVAALWQGDTDAAREHALSGAQSAAASGDRWFLAYCRNLQGRVATAREEYAAARRHHEAAYAIRDEFGDPEGMAYSTVHLARVAALQADRAEADRLYQRGLAIARDIGERRLMADALNGLGMNACASGDLAAAGSHFAEGLRLAVEAGYVRHILTLLASAGDWLLQTGRPKEAAAPLALACAHPAGDHETRPRARQLLSNVASVLPPDVYDATVERSRSIDPVDLAAFLVPLLTAPLPAGIAAASPPSLPQHPAATPALVEPLTARELSLLRLIAAGHSNREIADELFLTLNTVRTYNRQLYGKLGVGSRTQAVARARELGLLT